MSTVKTPKKTEDHNIESIFIEGADFTSEKLNESEDVNTLIERTLEQQMEVLRLNQLDQDELRTVVQL